MGWSKQDLVNQAFEKIGLASYIYELQPDQIQSAIRTMDAMVAVWNAQGVLLSYPLPVSPNDSSLNEASGVSDFAVEAIVANLAIRLASTVGKEPSGALRMEAKNAENVLLALAGPAPRMRMPTTTPAGAGNKTWRSTDRPFLSDDDDAIEAGPDGELEFKG